MTPSTQSIIFNNNKRSIHHVDPGMVESIINMTYMQELLITDCCIFLREKKDSNGEADVILKGEEGECKIASVINDPDVIETIKEVKTLGNSVAISLSKECKMLGISPGDRIRIRIEKADGYNETRQEI